MSTKANWLVTATVDGVPWGKFERFSGGNFTGDAQKRHSAGMGGMKSHAGLSDWEDVTIGRDFDRTVDHERLRALALRGNRAIVSVSRIPLDEAGAPWGKPRTYTGRLNGITDPDTDSNSSDVDELELVVQVYEVA